MQDSSGSVGQLDPNCDCMLLDDDGNEVREGQPGELYVRGPNICLGYWRNPQATKESLSPDGWLRSGDVAIVKNGWFWIVDRKKVSNTMKHVFVWIDLLIYMQELIKVNALQVAPAELEAVLLELDPIADAAAVGITIGGQEWPRAYVTLKDEYKNRTTVEDIHRHMKIKQLGIRIKRHNQMAQSEELIH
jgi:acyl-CoA synthetase (AMP-forming)/AMP-acid ligase II